MTRPLRSLSYVLAGLLALSLSACAPSLSPLYSDYEIQTDVEGQTIDQPLAERIAEALAEAGWQSAPSSAPNAIATEERRVRSWGLYNIVVSLEAVPVGESYVRLYLHPYRKYFTGNRSKIPYLKRGLRRALLKDLNETFERQGLVAVGTKLERNRQASAR